MAIRSAVVIGSGIVGLSTAWFLQEHGVSVTVLDGSGVGAGASEANAGWVMPDRATPLTEPSAIREGVTGLLQRDAAFRIASWTNPSVWGFLLRFASNSTPRRWARARAAMAGLNGEALAAFDQLTASGEVGPIRDTPIVAAFRTPHEAQHLPAGPDLASVDPDAARHDNPQLGEQVSAVIRMDGTRLVQPDEFIRSLAAEVARRGATFKILQVESVGTDGAIETTEGALGADAVVIATGAELARLAAPLGVRASVRAGRGYSFVVPTDVPVPAPIYLPTQRLACSPVDGGLRVAGIMEIGSPSSAPRPDRFESMARAASQLLRGVRWHLRTDEWTGNRPLTSDGLPVIGATRTTSVFVAGGHGMWGVTQGPATGKLLAQQIVNGRIPEQLVPLSPTR